jgi:hypothetical protein
MMPMGGGDQAGQYGKGLLHGEGIKRPNDIFDPISNGQPFKLKGI